MEDKFAALIALGGAGYITVLEVCALLMNQDGTYLAAVVAAIGVIIGGVLGFGVGKKSEKAS